LACFVFLSVLIHVVLAGAMPSPAALPTETELKKPIWVDLVNVSDPEAPEPASLAPAAQPPAAPPPSVTARKPLPPEERVPGKRPDNERPLPADPTDIPVKREPEVPPVKDLIPSMQNLLAMQQNPSNPTNPVRAVQMGPPQDGAHRRPAETQYEQYLMELKRKVERNWQVSLDMGIREGVTVIYVIVAGDGSLFSCDIIKPSGMITHDYEAREAVVQAFPLSPPPKNLLNEKGILPIRFSFHYLLAPPT